MRFEDLSVPPAAAAFLRANPGYVKRHAGAGMPAEEAYFRFRVVEDWTQLQPHLPPAPFAALDLGCGVGGVALLLAREGGADRLTVVDKSRREHEQGSFDVVGAARELLEANGVASGSVRALSSQDPGLHALLRRERFDLVVSLRALGYMFPYEAYRETLLACLKPGGRLVLDLRLMDSGALRGKPVIEERFRLVGFPSEREVLARLEADFGPAAELGRAATYVRVLVRARAAGP